MPRHMQVYDSICGIIHAFDFRITLYEKYTFFSILQRNSHLRERRFHERGKEGDYVCKIAGYIRNSNVSTGMTIFVQTPYRRPIMIHNCEISTKIEEYEINLKNLFFFGYSTCDAQKSAHQSIFHIKTSLPKILQRLEIDTILWMGNFEKPNFGF